MAKTGAHIALGPRTGYGLFCTSKPAVVISVDDGGALLEAAQKSNGHTTTIFRDTSAYLEAPPDFNTHPNMIALAQAWYPTLKAKWLQNPADYYTITNEIGGGEGPDVPVNLTKLVAYEREIMRLANLDGFKVCILNHATGSPGDFEVWKQICAPFIVEAWASGNIYGRHVYGGGDLVDGSGNVLPGGPLRPFQELDHLRSLGAAGGMALTEVGLDGGFNYPGQVRTLAQMSGYEWALRLADEIIGLCWWTLGNHQSNANWQDALPAAAQYNLANPTPAWEWPGDIPPPGEPPMANILLNGNFEGSWYHPGGVPEFQIPEHWNLIVHNDTNPHDPHAFVPPEIRVLQKNQLPAGEWELFGLSENQAVKIFKGSGAWHATLFQNIAPSAAARKATVKGFADLVLSYTGGKRYATYDPNSPAGLWRVNNSAWYLTRPGEKNTAVFDVPANSNVVTVEMMCPYPLANSGFFFDDWTCEDIVTTPPPTEPPPPTGATFPERLWNASITEQNTNGIVFNPALGLWQKILDDGLAAVTHERAFEGVVYQAAEKPDRSERWVYTWTATAGITRFKWPPLVPPIPLPTPFEFETYPVQGQTLFITSSFNAPRDYGIHEGIDLKAATGAAIVAVADGVVEYVRNEDISGYGLYVRVNHDGRYKTWYAHMLSVNVALGQFVQAGHVLGLADNTGNSTGSHLHLTLQDLEEGLDGYVVAKVVDPAPFLAKFGAGTVDMAPYFVPTAGDYGDICILKNNWGQGDERQQLQRSGSLSFVTKNSAWERRRIASDGIYLELDTSPGNGEYYTVTGSAWLPLRWNPGQEHTRTETVKFFSKANCTATQAPYTVTNKIKFAALHSAWTSPAGVQLANVIELQWLIAGVVEESYWFAPGKGLVQWKNKAGRHSWVTSIVPVGQQGNNVRESGCFG